MAICQELIRSILHFYPPYATTSSIIDHLTSTAGPKCSLDPIRTGNILFHSFECRRWRAAVTAINVYRYRSIRPIQHRNIDDSGMVTRRRKIPSLPCRPTAALGLPGGRTVFTRLEPARPSGRQAPRPGSPISIWSSYFPLFSEDSKSKQMSGRSNTFVSRLIANWVFNSRLVKFQSRQMRLCLTYRRLHQETLTSFRQRTLHELFSVSESASPCRQY